MPIKALSSELGIRSLSMNQLREKYRQTGSTYVPCMGLQVHVCIVGTGPDLVLVHGFGASLHTWNAVADVLKKQFRVIRFDVPPFGLTGAVVDEKGKPKKLNVAFYQEFMDSILNELGITRCFMIGNSFGGFLCWDQANRNPERVKALILSDSVGYAQRPPFYVDVFRFRLVGWLIQFMLPAVILRLALRDVYGDPKKLQRATVSRYLDLFLHHSTRLAVPKMVGVFTEGELGEHRIKEIQCKTLIIWGSADRWVNLESAVRFHRDIQGSELKLYRGVGHVPMEEVPERFANDCMTWFDELTLETT